MVCPYAVWTFSAYQRLPWYLIRLLRLYLRSQHLYQWDGPSYVCAVCGLGVQEDVLSTSFLMSKNNLYLLKRAIVEQDKDAFLQLRENLEI